MESLRRSNVATYAIDRAGTFLAAARARVRSAAPPGGGRIRASAGTVVRQAQHGLRVMAAASGGFAVTNTDDLMCGLDRIVEDLDHYYLLGFYPTDNGGKRYRAIDVRFRRPHWPLHFRRGYARGTADAAEERRSAGRVLGGRPADDRSAVPSDGHRVPRIRQHHACRARARGVRARARPRGGRRAGARRLRYEVLVVDESEEEGEVGVGTRRPVDASPTGSAASPGSRVLSGWRNVDLTPGR